jgi:histidine triad (HIT) family protein
MKDCIFCQVVSGKLPSTRLYEDASVIVIKDIYPQAPIHWIILPKKHITELLNAEDKLVHHMMNVAKKIIRDDKIVGYRLVNNGKGAAVIDHLHLHVMGKVDKLRAL